MKKIKLPFIKHNIAPYACSSIGIYNEQNELVGNIDIGKIKHSYKLIDYIVSGYYQMYIKIQIIVHNQVLILQML